jgi:hypothetical protein
VAAAAARAVAEEAHAAAELARDDAAQPRRAVEEQAAVMREMQDTLHALLRDRTRGVGGLTGRRRGLAHRPRIGRAFVGRDPAA